MGKRKRLHNHKDTDEITFENSEEENHSNFEKKLRVHQHGQRCQVSPPPVNLSNAEEFPSQQTIPQQDWDADLTNSTSSKAQPSVTVSTVAAAGDAAAVASPPGVPNGASTETGCSEECNNVCVTSSAAPCVGGRSLRISARVQNKQRREEARDLAASHVHKKIELSDDEEEAPAVPNKKQRRRQWELWSAEDKDFFFEAINECGKNFESLQNSLSTKMRKKGMPGYQVKNKDQVRHFYYRTWHKIAKYISFSGVAKKSTQEVYGLVNYGEFRRRVGGTLDCKRGLKLRELVLHGSTSLRLKGRTIRVRTPLCRALKRFHQPWDRGSVGQRLPCRVTVSVSAASQDAWARVQGLAHNPRVRAVLPLDKPVSTLLQHLANKWRAAALKMRDSLSSSTHFKVSVPPVPEPTLRLLPPPNSSITLSRLTQRDAVRPLYFSLQSHEAWLQKMAINKSLSGSNTSKRIDCRRRKRLSRGGAAGGDSRGSQEDRRPHQGTEGGAPGEGEDISQEETEGSDGDELMSGEERPSVKSVSVQNGYRPLPTSEEESVLSPGHPAALRTDATTSLGSNTPSSGVGPSTDPLNLNSAETIFNIFSPEDSSSRERYCSTALEICDIKSGERTSGVGKLEVDNTTSQITSLPSGRNNIISVISSSSVTSGGGDSNVSCGSILVHSSNSKDICDKQTSSNATAAATKSSPSSLMLFSEFVSVKEEAHGYEDDAMRQLLALESAAEGVLIEHPPQPPPRPAADTEDDEEDEEDEEEDAEADDEDDEDEEEIEELEDDDEEDDPHHNEEDHHHGDLLLDQGRDDDGLLLHHPDDETTNGEHVAPSEASRDEGEGKGQGESEEVATVAGGEQETKDAKLLLDDNKEAAVEAEDHVSQEEMENKIEAVRRGWTEESVGRLTVGELFIMLGQKEPLHLYYEFEDAATQEKKENDSTDAAVPLSTTTLTPKQCSSEQLSTAPPLLSPARTQFPASSLLSPPPNTFAAPSTRPLDADTTKPPATSPNKSLSGMLEQLLSMSRQLFQNKSLSVDGNMGCICGGGGGKGLRSPRGGGVVRSPRGTTLRSPDVGGRAISAADKAKPTSAKRLIAPDTAEDASQQASTEASVSPCRDTAEFRVPAPPRPLSTQASIEAQLAVLPRYNQRNRGRKHMVVQRQLPLLSKQQSAVIGAASLFPNRPHYRPLQPKPLLFPSSAQRQQGTGLRLASPAHIASNAISVNVSGKQLLTVRLPPPPPSPSPASASSNPVAPSGDSLDSSQSRITVKILCTSASSVGGHRTSVGNSMPITVSVGSPLASNASILGLPSQYDISDSVNQRQVGRLNSSNGVVKDELNTPPVTPSPGPSPSPGLPPYSPSLPLMSNGTTSAQWTTPTYTTNSMPSGVSFTIGDAVNTMCPSAYSGTVLPVHCSTPNLVQQPDHSSLYNSSGRDGIRQSSSGDRDMLLMSNNNGFDVPTSSSAVQSTPVRYRPVDCTPATSPTQCNSMLNTPKFCPQLPSNTTLDLLQSATKNISSLLTTPDDHAIPQLHIPDDACQLPLLDISLSASFGIDDAKIHVKDRQLLQSTLQTGGVSSAADIDAMTSSQSPSITTFENLAEAIDLMPSSQVTVTTGSTDRSQQSNNHNIHTNNTATIVSNPHEFVTGSLSSGNNGQTLLCSNNNNRSSVMQLHHGTNTEALSSSSRYVASGTTATGDSFMTATLPPVSSTSMIGGMSTVVVTSTSAATSSRVSNNINSTLDSHLNPNWNTTAPAGKSPTSLSALPISETSSDRLFDISLGNSNSSFSSLLAAVVNPSSELMDTSSMLNTPPRSRVPPPHPSSPLSRPSPPSSPSRLIPREEHQWMSGEVADFSLSSLLNSIETEISSGKSGVTQGEMHPSQAPPSVTLLAALNENGVDFTAKFDALSSSDSLNGATDQ